MNIHLDFERNLSHYNINFYSDYIFDFNQHVYYKVVNQECEIISFTSIHNLNDAIFSNHEDSVAHISEFLSFKEYQFAGSITETDNFISHYYINEHNGTDGE